LKVAGVLLAAGSSSRLGKPKQLLQWHGSLLINHITNIIKSSKVDDLVVVLGYKRQAIEQALDKTQKIYYNNEWQKGKSESIKLGLKSVSDEYDAVMYFTIDQPFISRQLIDCLIDKASKSISEIIATRSKNISTIPMLFKKTCFDQLNSLVGEEGGKKIISNPDLSIDYVEWEDARILIDIDTESGYHRALKADIDSYRKSNDLI